MENKFVKYLEAILFNFSVPDISDIVHAIAIAYLKFFLDSDQFGFFFA